MSNEVIPRRPHGNSGLFSEHYLNITLPEIDGWHELAIEAASVMEKISEVFYSYSPGNEAQTEETLIRPILRALGHTFEVQVSLGTSEGIKVPDYVIYRDEAALAQNRERTLTEKDFVGRAIAIGEAKAWDRPLSDSLKGGSKNFDNRNPSFQISFYMLHSGTEWGILTNGRLWRLYHRDSAHRLDHFYEIDLPEILKTGDAQTFLYFYAFFRRAAFDDAPLTVGAFLTGSAEYARSIEESLRLQVYDALRHIAQGFLDYPKNGLAREPEDLRKVYDASLILLYRILFVLYAEARELLPVNRNSAYRDEYSISGIKREVAERLDSGAMIPAGRARLWNRLGDLFDAISDGDDVLGIPTYNGGLFDDSKHPFLAEKVVGDRHLQRALDRLARVNGQFVDYRDLSERHLGTVYEGLLEYHLEAANEADESGDEADGWTIALRNSEGGERHDTGSYYTPDFIVKHIVERTVGPALEAAIADCRTDEERIEAVLALNVLDPAMGSGHFLVEVTEYIARFLVGIGVSEEDEGDAAGQDAELARWKRRVVQSCVYGVDLNPLAVELAKLSLWLSTVAEDRPLSFLDHHLRCGNSLVGAAIPDPRPRGKGWEAKKSARKRKAKSPDDAQLSMMDDDAFRRSMSAAVGSMWEIEESPAESADEVKQQERLYAEIRKDLDARYARLANLATAASGFGVAADPALWNAVTEYATKNTAAVFPQFEQWLGEAEEIAEEQRFFHWKLEFPEVFFDREGAPLGGDAGFDAVVGNPPYIRQKHLKSFAGYFGSFYPETHGGSADIYVYFFEAGANRLREGGYISYIVSSSWIRTAYGKPLRNFLRDGLAVTELVDLGDNRVFKDAPDLYPIIVVARKSQPTADHEANVATFNRGEGLSNFKERLPDKLAPVALYDQPDDGWQLTDPDGRRIFGKLMRHGKPFGEVVDGQIYYGIKTGFNGAFVVDRATRERLIAEDPASAEIIKPFVKGEDVRPWVYEDEGRFLIVLRSSGNFAWAWSELAEDDAEKTFCESYPSLYAHMKPHEDRLRKRQDKGRFWWELRACDYYDLFEGGKIIWPDIANFPRFTIGDAGMHTNNTSYFAPTASAFHLGILSSRVMWFALSNLGQSFGERKGSLRFRLFTQSMSRLPVPDAGDDERLEVGRLAEEITAEARERYKLHERSRRRIVSDLRPEDSDAKPNTRLGEWWNLDFAAFRREVKKSFGAEIPLSERDDWEDWLESNRDKHRAATAKIIASETELNRRVYDLFDLGPEEIKHIEASTKYRYGEL